MLRQLRERHELLWALTLKQLKVRYKRATLGILWTVLNPLLQMVVLTTIFLLVLRIPVPRYPLLLLAGLLPWTFSPPGLAAREGPLSRHRDGRNGWAAVRPQSPEMGAM